MRKKIKGFLKDSIIYGIGDGIGRLTNLILLPILTRIFALSDYGVIDILAVTYSFILMTFNLNILTGLQKFYYLTTGQERKILVTSVLCGIVFFNLIIAIGVILPMAENFSKILSNNIIYKFEIIILAWCLPIETLFNSLTLLLRLKRRAALFSFISIARMIITTLTTYMLVVWLHTGIAGVFEARILSLSILSFLLFFLEKNEFFPKISITSFKKILLFSLPGLPAIMISSLMNILPRYFLSGFSTMSAVGTYGIAHRIAQFITMYCTSFKKSWSPFAFAHVGQKDEKIIYEKIFKYFLLTLILLGSFLTIFAKDFLIILTPVQYHKAHIFVGGLCFYYSLLGIRSILSTALYSSNKVKYTSYLNIVNVSLFCIIAYILVPIYSLSGLIIALIISGSIYIGLYVYIVQKNLYFNISFLKFGLILLVTFVSMKLLLIYSTYSNISYITKSIFYIVYTIFCVTLLLNKNEKNIMLQEITSFFTKDK